MISPKWVNNRIQFELAPAIVAANGKLHIDDALILAATPSVLVDYANEQDSNLKYICRAMRKFFKKNPRFTQFTKAAVAEGLRHEWLPNLEPEEKAQMLADFKIVLGVDADGFVIYNPKWVDVFTASPNPDKERYGKGTYTPPVGRAPRPRLRQSGALTVYFHSTDAEGYTSAPLAITADEWYEIIKDASPVVVEFLKCYLQVPDGIASCTEIEQMFGIPWNMINARNSALGNRAQSMLNIAVYDAGDINCDGSRKVWSTPMLRGREEQNGFRWQMRPELLEAARRLAREEQWQPLTRIDH